jgi:cytochrome c oxidase subunit 2
MQEIRQASRKGGAGRFVIVGILVLVSTALLYLGMISANLLPVEASLQGKSIDALFNFHFLAISFLFSLIIVFLLYSVIVYRRRKGDNGYGVFRRGNSRLEILWTVIPLIAVLTISTVSASNLADTMAKDPQALVVNVTAGQWFWSFEYPDTGVVSPTLNLPVNRQVLLRMTSKDVIHSFWVPEFRVKQDVLPGENLVKELRITPTLVGSYKVRCAEMCGASHAYMESPVIVMEPSAYDAWMQDQVSQVATDPITRGANLAKTIGCVGCHSADGKAGAGPTWKGLFGSQVKLASGETVTADEAYLKESILHPNAQISEGFNPGLMPTNYGDTLTADQLSDLIEYIKSLK